MSGEPPGIVHVATTERDAKSTTLIVPASRLLTYRNFASRLGYKPVRAASGRQEADDGEGVGVDLPHAVVGHVGHVEERAVG